MKLLSRFREPKPDVLTYWYGMWSQSEEMDEHGVIIPGRERRCAAIILGTAEEKLRPEGHATRHWDIAETRLALAAGYAAIAEATNETPVSLVGADVAESLVIPGGWYERRSFLDHSSRQRQPRLRDKHDYPHEAFEPPDAWVIRSAIGRIGLSRENGVVVRVAFGRQEVAEFAASKKPDVAELAWQTALEGFKSL